MIPDRAIGFDQSKKYVFVVSHENKVGYREVALGHELGGLRVVTKGLAAGERVIVDGLQRVRADAAVIPKEVPPSAPVAGDTASQVAQAGDAVQQKEEAR